MAEEMQKKTAWVEKDPGAASDEPIIVFDHVDMIFNIASPSSSTISRSISSS